MLRRRAMMGSKGGGLALHWDYTMGSPLDFGFVADINGQAEMQGDGFFMSASSTSACVVSALDFPIRGKCPDFEIANGFEIAVKFKIVKNSGWSDLISINVYDKNNTYERCCAVSSLNAVQVNNNTNKVTITYPSNNEVIQRFVMKEGKLSAYFNEYAKENVSPSRTSSTEEPHIRINISNNWYNNGTTSVLIESIDITLNKRVIQPIINLSLTDVTNNVIVNKGAGGATYNATISDYSTTENHASDASGLTLNKRAYAKVVYGFNASKSFTLCVRGRINTLSELQYQMLFWTEKDSLSVYRSNKGSFDIKLTNQTSGMIADSPKASVSPSGVALVINTSYISYLNDHTYVFIGNTETGIVSLYIDGELIGHQPMSSLPSSTSILLGDNSGEYYANQINISEVRVWDYAVDINSI